MGALRSIIVLTSLLSALLAGVQATLSTAITRSRQDAAPTAADCTVATGHCVFMPWMRIPAAPPTFEQLALVPGDISTVEVSGSYAYLGQSNQLLVVDVSDPRQPQVIGGLQLKDFRLPYITDIEVQPPLAYVSTVDHFTSCCVDVQLHLVDISQPARPRLISSSSGIGGGDIEVVDQRVYATGLHWLTNWPDVAIADVLSASSVVERGYYGERGSWGVAVNGSIVYVADDDNRILVIDAGDPDHLKLITAISTPATPYNLSIDGSYLYVAMVNNLGIFDIRTPEHPVARSIREFPGFPLDLEVANGWAYTGLSSMNLSIIDVHNPDLPELVAAYSPIEQGQINALEVDGSLVYLATSSGLRIAQVTAQ